MKIQCQMTKPSPCGITDEEIEGLAVAEGDIVSQTHEMNPYSTGQECQRNVKIQIPNFHLAYSGFGDLADCIRFAIWSFSSYILRGNKKGFQQRRLNTTTLSKSGLGLLKEFI